MSTTQELLAANERYDALREQAFQVARTWESFANEPLGPTEDPGRKAAYGFCAQVLLDMLERL